MMRRVIQGVNTDSVDWSKIYGVMVAHPILGWVDYFEWHDHCQKFYVMWSSQVGHRHARGPRTFVIAGRERSTKEAFKRFHEDFSSGNAMPMEQVTYHLVTHELFNENRMPGGDGLQAFLAQSRSFIPPAPDHLRLHVMYLDLWCVTYGEADAGLTPTESNTKEGKDKPHPFTVIHGGKSVH